jgi:endonuclease YncB( thermonuclease family)
MFRSILASAAILLTMLSTAEAAPAGRCGALALGQLISGPGRALDGSNLWLARQDFQIFAIKAAEIESTRGVSARSMLDRLVHGKEVTCRLIGCNSTRQFNQPIAICTAGNIDLGEALLRAGAALTVRTQLFTESEIDQSFIDRYLAAEFDARDARRGLWSEVPP